MANHQRSCNARLDASTETVQLPDQDRPEIIHIRARRPRHKQITHRIERRPGIVACQHRLGIHTRRAHTRDRRASAKAPALSSEPSIPSVSAASAWILSAPPIAMANASRNSHCGRPCPWPRKVTVVSPPDRISTGFWKGRLRGATSRAIAAWTPPTSRASPSMESERMTASIPCRFAWAAAASSDTPAEAIRCTSLREKRDRPGLAHRRRRVDVRHDGVRQLHAIGCIDASASARLPASGRSGRRRPKPDCRRGCRKPPATRLWPDAAAASRPPLMVETCLRMVFMAAIGAPEASSASLMAISSASVRPRQATAAAPSRRPKSAPRPDHRVPAPAPSPAAAARPGDRLRPAPDARPRDLDALAFGAIAVAGDDQPFDRPVPDLLERRRHLRRALAGADDDGATLRPGRQMIPDRALRIGGGDGGIEDRDEEGFGIESSVIQFPRQCQFALVDARDDRTSPRRRRHGPGVPAGPEP